MLQRWLMPLVFLSLLWGLITKGDVESLVVGFPCVLLALVAFQHLGSSQDLQFKLHRLPGFALWFLRESLRGGIDVATRALSPSVKLDPGFHRYPMNLPQGSVRVFFVNCLSLLPGTLSAAIEQDDVILHVLDSNQAILTDTRTAETRVAKLFGIVGEDQHG